MVSSDLPLQSNVCYRHRSTQDEAQDDKLRSKTAALAVVGIGPADLGVDLGESLEGDPEALSKKNEEISEHLEQARKDLIAMNQKRYPLGKLNCLKAAHRSIVDTLSYFHPSSSADMVCFSRNRSFLLRTYCSGL